MTSSHRKPNTAAQAVCFELKLNQQTESVVSQLMDGSVCSPTAKAEEIKHNGLC